MTAHRIKVKLERNNDGTERAVPQLPAKLVVNDTVSYFSDDGEVTVTFEGSLFGTVDVIHHGETRVLRRAGVFFCKCSIRKPNGDLVEWSLKNPKSGGDHDVKPAPTG